MTDDAQLHRIGDLVTKGLSAAGYATTCEQLGGWLRVTVVACSGQLSFGLKVPEVQGLSAGALPFRIGVSLEFGHPCGAPVAEEPESFIYLPESFTVDEFLRLVAGDITVSSYTDIVNFSSRYAMSAPRERFPSSILVLIKERTDLRTAGDKFFELWTQSAGEVAFHQLARTNNPHTAAEEARAMGFLPTVYRCSSGALVPFKTTDGGVFL